MSMREAATGVVRRLQQAGHVAYFAGGCVRDMVMGRRPHDYDVATSATPADVLSTYPRGQKVGAKFGVVLVRVGGHSIEVATFRRDVAYHDGRRPSAVQFTDAAEDALRRDFTINGMFYDPLARRLVDHVGGERDIRRRVIRAIGDPSQRFAEDHLRMLRAIRLAARLDFRIEPRTWEAIRGHARDIARISAERIRAELEAMLEQPRRQRAFDQLCDSGLLEHLWPGADRLLPERRRISATLGALDDGVDFATALAVVLHPLAGRDAGRACLALRCSNETKKAVCWLVARQDALTEPEAVTLADLKLLMAQPEFPKLLEFFAAKLKGEGRPVTAYRTIAARVRAIRPEDVAPPPLVDGHDLAALGVPQGPRYKQLLARTYYAQLNGELKDRAAARAYVQKLLAQGGGT